MNMNRFTFFCILVLLPCLTGCATLFPEPGTPPRKFTLTYLKAYPKLKSIRVQPHGISIDVPHMYQPLDSRRIAVRPSAQQIDYYADVEWADRLVDLVHESLIYSLENSQKLAAVGRPTEGIRTDRLLKTEVRGFHILPSRDGQPSQAEVAYSVKLVKVPDQEVIRSVHIVKRVPVSAYTIVAIVEALNQAHLDATRDLVHWIVGYKERMV